MDQKYSAHKKYVSAPKHIQNFPKMRKIQNFLEPIYSYWSFQI